MSMLYVIVFTVELGLGIVSPLLPEIMLEFSLAAWQIGLMVTIYGLARLMTDIPLGLLLDRVDRTWALAAGAMLIVLGSMGCGLAQSYGFMLAARLLMGVGTALCLLTALFVVSRATHASSRGRSIGIYQATMVAGATISPAIGGVAASLAGWRAAFYFAAFAGVVALLMILVASRRGLLQLSTPPGETAAAPEKASPAETTAVRIPWNLVAINFTTFIFHLSVAGFRNSMVPVYGGTALRMSSGTLGLLLGGSALIRFVITLGSGFASDRWGRKVILVPGIVLLATGTLGFALATDTLGFVICLVVLSLGGFGNSIPTTMLVDAVPPRQVGMAISTNRAVGDLGMLIGPLGLGLILDIAGFPVVAAVTAVLLMSALPGIAFGVHEGKWEARKSARSGTS